jgi:hypothetical protein
MDMACFASEEGRRRIDTGSKCMRRWAVELQWFTLAYDCTQRNCEQRNRQDDQDFRKTDALQGSSGMRVFS